MHPKLKGVALMKLDEKELYSLNVHVLTSKYKQMDCLNFSSQWLLRGHWSTQNPFVNGSSLAIYT